MTKSSYRQCCTRRSAGAIGFDESKTFTGWTVGAGIEHAFTDNWIGSVEYRYADFGSETIGNVVDVVRKRDVSDVMQALREEFLDPGFEEFTN